jgi:hypothetical protein
MDVAALSAENDQLRQENETDERTPDAVYIQQALIAA